MLASGLTTTAIDPEKGGGVILHERQDWEPTGVAPELLAEARSTLLKLVDNLRGMAETDPETLSMMIGRLLAHRWRGRAEDASDLMREALIIDWIEDVGEYPAWAIEAAMREWRRNEEWAPTIANIRRLCEEQVSDDRRSLRLIGRLLAAQDTEDESEARASLPA